MSRLLDTHIHIDNGAVPEPKRLLDSMDRAGVDRAVLLAEEPSYFEKSLSVKKADNAGRMERLMQWTKDTDGRLLPVYFIDPTERDAIEQIDRALDMGVIGFKIICETFYPGDDRAMPVYQHIADADKAILFHAGILYDYGNNGNFCRPCNFECMFDVSNIRFALAHIAWPWTDECIALYGKFNAMAYHPKYQNQKMYIDLTPGTPSYYRQRAMDAMGSVAFDDGYEWMDERVLFGSDSFTSEFNAQWIADLAAADREKLRKARFYDEVIDKIMYDNALGFWGIK